MAISKHSGRSLGAMVLRITALLICAWSAGCTPRQPSNEAFGKYLVLNGTGAHLYLKRDYKGAYSAFNDSLQYMPNYWQTLYRMGMCDEQMGNYQGSLKLYESALSAKPPDGEPTAMVYFNLGRVEWKLGQRQEAIDFEERAIKISEANKTFGMREKHREEAVLRDIERK